MVRRLFLALLLCLVPAGAMAQPAAPHAALAWLLGSWKGSGSFSGQPTESGLEVTPALGGKFVELSYRFRTAGQRPFTFEGRAFYRRGGEGAWKADWYDSRGMALPIVARLEGSSLTSDWGGPGTEQGRTVYRLLGDGRLEVVDSVLGADGTRREFARNIFARIR